MNANSTLRRQQGFTLIEILVVLVIIGITVSFAVIAFGDFGASRRVVFAAEQFANALQLAQQQAILQGSTLGMRLDDQGYQIVVFRPPSHWNTLPNKKIFQFHAFPHKTWIHLKTNEIEPHQGPAIIINASGDTTPFTLQMGNQKDTPLVTLTVRHNGSISFKQFP